MMSSTYNCADRVDNTIYKKRSKLDAEIQCISGQSAERERERERQDGGRSIVDTIAMHNIWYPLVFVIKLPDGYTREPTLLALSLLALSLSLPLLSLSLSLSLSWLSCMRYSHHLVSSITSHTLIGIDVSYLMYAYAHRIHDDEEYY